MQGRTQLFVKGGGVTNLDSTIPNLFFNQVFFFLSFFFLSFFKGGSNPWNPPLDPPLPCKYHIYIYCHRCPNQPRSHGPTFHLCQLRLHHFHNNYTHYRKTHLCDVLCSLNFAVKILAVSELRSYGNTL